MPVQSDVFTRHRKEVTRFSPKPYHRVVRVLLLHGFAGDPAAWDAVIAAGLGQCEPIAVALPGHAGEPVRESWQANLDAIDTHGATWVVGYSLGARVALGLVAEQRVSRALLVSVNPGFSDEAARTTRRIADAQWVALLRERGIEAFVDAWEAQPLFATQARVAPQLLAARRARRLALDPAQLARSLETMGLAEMPDYREALRASDAGLVVGADDTKFVDIASEFPNNMRFRIEDCGHDVPLEQPTALATVIRALT